MPATLKLLTLNKDHADSDLILAICMIRGKDKSVLWRQGAMNLGRFAFSANEACGGPLARAVGAFCKS